MGCATALVKYIMFFFNFLFVVGGAALIALGVLQYNGYKEYKEITAEIGPYQASPIVLWVIGGIILFIAFMGCCGTLRESKCMMMTYSTFLGIILILEVALAVGIYMNQDDIKTWVKDGLEKSLKEYNNDDTIRQVWDDMQKNLKCCGVNSYADWGINVPSSCCANQENCSNLFGTGVSLLANQLTDKEVIYKQGCVDKVFNELKTEYGMYGAAILALVELVGIVFGCCLGARFGRKLYHT